MRPPKQAKVMAGTESSGNGLEPRKVAEKIIKAIVSKNPKHRYVVGKMGKLYIFLKGILGTRIFDSLLQIIV